MAYTTEDRRILGTDASVWSDVTVLGSLRQLYKHIHNPGLVWPSLLNGITLTSHNDAWTLGDKATLIDTGDISEAFDIHFLAVENMSATDVYEIHLFSGAGDDLIAQVRLSRTAAMDSTNNLVVQIPIQAAGTRIRAAVAAKTGGGKTVTVSVFYHLYA